MLTASQHDCNDCTRDSLLLYIHVVFLTFWLLSLRSRIQNQKLQERAVQSISPANWQTVIWREKKKGVGVVLDTTAVEREGGREGQGQAAYSSRQWAGQRRHRCCIPAVCSAALGASCVNRHLTYHTMLSTWNAENINQVGPSQRGLGGGKSFKPLGDAGAGRTQL